MFSFMHSGIEYKFYDHLYAVSKCGNVLRNFIPYIPVVRTDGYLSLGRRRLAHRVVASCWIDNPENAKHVHHKNGIKSDNRADNLEWIMPKKHAEKHPVKPYIRTPESIAKFIKSKTGIKDNETSRIKKKARLITIVPRTSCKYKGIEYPSITEAARTININKSTFRIRCLSKNFPDYEIVSLYYSGSPKNE